MALDGELMRWHTRAALGGTPALRSVAGFARQQHGADAQGELAWCWGGGSLLPCCHTSIAGSSVMLGVTAAVLVRMPCFHTSIAGSSVVLARMAMDMAEVAVSKDADLVHLLTTYRGWLLLHGEVLHLLTS